MSDALGAARQYLELGWQPVVAPLRGKSPRGQWKLYQTERITPRYVEDSFVKPANIFLITGSISQLAVLDCDDEKAVEWWRSQLPEVDKTTCVRTGNGYHFYFKLEPGEIRRSASNEDLDSGKWDIRAEGGGVVAPPSVHPTGRVYEWERDPNFLLGAPARLWELAGAGAGAGAEGGQTRSLLTHLLQNRPNEGGRNTWLSKVAGHYARHIPHRDAFEQMVRDANETLQSPLPSEEVDKLIASIWASESSKGVGADEPGARPWREHLKRPTEENGWLVSGGERILCQTKRGQGEDAVYGLDLWMDTDIRVLGIIAREDGDERRDLVYSVELRYPGGKRREDYLPVADASDYRRLTTWLAARNATFGAPDNAFPRKPADHVRFLRYLKSQEGQPMEAADALGWHRESEAFITHDGVIRKLGFAPHEHVRPDPALRKWAPYRYGHGGRDEARSVLAEVLTFHDETVASVFGSWWAAVLLKPQIQEKASQFPFMAIEAPSESGKTKGFFPLMMQLAGNASGNVQPTRASLRDYLSAHNNGIVWMDDLDSLEAYGEILRNVTVGGSMVKKGQDNTSQVVATMRSALVISGEALGLRSQKALIDRAILLDVSSPMSRRSLKDSKRPQWDDIVELTQQYPDLTEFAGSVIELALEQAGQVRDLKKLRHGSGRHADAMAIVRLGARILRGMLGDLGTGIVERVDEWTKRQTTAYTGRENALTLKLLPLALATTGWLERPLPPDEAHRRVATPVFVGEDGIVWFSPLLLSEWWVREPKAARKVSDRTESLKALTDQAKELGLGGKKGVGRADFKLAGTQKTMRYWVCPPDLSEALLQRSRGVDNVEDGEEEDEVGDSLI